jgi:hypothetical protein
LLKLTDLGADVSRVFGVRDANVDFRHKISAPLEPLRGGLSMVVFESLGEVSGEGKKNL